MSFTSLYWVRIGGACVVLLLAVAYLLGFVKSALVGFALVGAAGGIAGYRLRKGTLPAVCDLCGGEGRFSAEYGAGFSNARLILTCRRCGRVVNRAQHGVRPEKE